MKTDPYGYPISPEDLRYSGWTEDRETPLAFVLPLLQPRPVSDEIPDAEVLARYVSPFSIRMDDGKTRDMNNLEMSQLLAEKRKLAYERRDTDGCCGEPGHEGRCYGCGGWCPRATEAATAEAFCMNFIKWLETKENEHVDDDRNQTSGGRAARTGGQSKIDYDPADDFR